LVVVILLFIGSFSAYVGYKTFTGEDNDNE
jgi:hypothetical protein